MYDELLRFFTLQAEPSPATFYSGENTDLVKTLCARLKLEYLAKPDAQAQYALIDLRARIASIKTLEQWKALRTEIFELCKNLFDNHQERRFITVIAQNIFIDGKYEPLAWDISYVIASIFSLKDEKIACLGESSLYEKVSSKNAGNENFYLLNFRKDENSQNSDELVPYSFRGRKAKFGEATPQWFILKPQRRNADEILHPAKYPEDLIDMYVSAYTKEGQNVYDPMSGTGSTQVGSLKLRRNAYGTELSDFFGEIARKRSKEVITPQQESLFAENNDCEVRIEIGDARDFRKFNFPKQHYLITSPPYWDMLNMKGAENQAKRIESGLRTNYSENLNDMGNINDYNEFLNSISALYFEIAELLHPKAKVTIVVKNIKKKGNNFPFAWDLCRILQEKFILLPENFWLQDDISIAPFGYGNTWVSNTFHQYCLQFQLP